MKIHTIIVGPIQTNCSIIFDEGSKEGIIIDPGEEAEKILSFVNGNSLKITSIIATHGHFDHVTAVSELKEKLKAPFSVHKKDAFLLSEAVAPFAAMLGFKAGRAKIDRLLKDHDLIEFKNNQFEVIHTPGHTQGSVCFYNRKGNVLFSGDTLFKGDVGRTDLPGGSTRQITQSVKKRLFVLPDETFVIPGHGQTTNILSEKNDPYLKGLIYGENSGQ
ncbi:MAG: MBL fold metallo-hydrolase [Candidatus Saganbacteria bacterium]|nr:MBL fold metallo-hydrolase [Candidatus Saganbacteria bacterium]